MLIYPFDIIWFILFSVIDANKTFDSKSSGNVDSAKKELFLLKEKLSDIQSKIFENSNTDEGSEWDIQVVSKLKNLKQEFDDLLELWDKSKDRY